MAGRIAGIGLDFPRGYSPDSETGYGDLVSKINVASYRPPDNGGPKRTEGQGTRIERRPNITAYQLVQADDGSGGPEIFQGQNARLRRDFYRYLQ